MVDVDWSQRIGCGVCESQATTVESAKVFTGSAVVTTE